MYLTQHVPLDSPEQFEQIVQPVSGEVSVRPYNGARFQGKLNFFGGKQLALFALQANSIRVKKAPPHDFYSLTVPLGASFSMGPRGHRRFFDANTAHLLTPAREFEITVPHDCRVLVINVPTQHFEATARKLADTERRTLCNEECFPLFRTELSTVVRSAARLFATLHANVSLAEAPPLFIEELEDALLTAMLLAFESPPISTPNPSHFRHTPTLDNAEAYLLEHLDTPMRRADLAAQTNVSIRTLSRFFWQRHGCGPMDFLKQIRLDAAYRDLLGADPDSLKVFDVAYRYGFRHLGKFAIEYKRVFGESPSVTLGH